jgi:FixJ family two-component response regulator
MSGYTDNPLMQQGLQAGKVSFLQKPFDANELASKVKEVLATAVA